ncbi:23S rRNA (guanosine(2251)-2'-O)-methyltransferase RlmB [Clostridium sp. DL1XJH146]
MANRNRDNKNNNFRNNKTGERNNEKSYDKNKSFKKNFDKNSEKKYKNDEKISTKEVREDLIEGRNAVIEALKSEKTVEQLYVAKGSVSGSITKIRAIAKEKGIVVKEVERKKLDFMSQTEAHQGVILQTTPYKYFEIEEIMEEARKKEEDPFVIVLDEIEDPHNFGAIIRTAEISGAHGIIIPKRRNVGVTSTVYKSSVGAVEHMKIAKVANINVAIDTLKDKGLWVFGADMEGTEYCYESKLTGPIALVIGSEGKGISKLTKTKCDKLVKIPMVGEITSLNASVAAGIMMYEVLKQKLEK